MRILIVRSAWGDDESFADKGKKKKKKERQKITAAGEWPGVTRFTPGLGDSGRASSARLRVWRCLIEMFIVFLASPFIYITLRSLQKNPKAWGAARVVSYMRTHKG